MKLLIFGEIVGKWALEKIKDNFQNIKATYKPDLIVANGDSLFDGYGINVSLAEEVLKYVDLITLGDYALNKKDFFEYLDNTEKVIRANNLPDSSPGKGFSIIKLPNGYPLLYVSLLGRNGFNKIFVNDPFLSADQLIEEYKEKCQTIIIDFHGGTTSEVQGAFWYFSKRVSLVYGSHLKTITNDYRVIDDWTGVITGVGYCGGEYSIGGLSSEVELKKILTGRHFYSKVEKENIVLQGIITEIDEKSGKCIKIELIKYK